MFASHVLSRRKLLSLSLQGGAGILLLSGCKEQKQQESYRDLFPIVSLGGADKSAQLAKEAGFDCMLAPVSFHLIPDQPEAEFVKRMEVIKALPLPVRGCNSFLPKTMRVTGPEADHETIEKHAKTVFQRAKRVGVERIVFGSGDARKVPEGFPLKEARAQFATLLRRLAPLAAAENVGIVVETLNSTECNLFPTVPDLLPIIAELNHPSVRLNADLYHMRKEEEDPQVLADAIPWLALVEIAEKEKRTVPGIAGDDFRPFFRVLQKHQWKGMLNMEGAATTRENYRRMFSVLDTQISESRA